MRLGSSRSSRRLPAGRCTVHIVDDDVFDPSVQFGMTLSDPHGCELGRYLSDGAAEGEAGSGERARQRLPVVQITSTVHLR